MFVSAVQSLEQTVKECDEISSRLVTHKIEIAGYDVSGAGLGLNIPSVTATVSLNRVTRPAVV